MGSWPDGEMICRFVFVQIALGLLMDVPFWRDAASGDGEEMEKRDASASVIDGSAHPLVDAVRGPAECGASRQIRQTVLFGEHAAECDQQREQQRGRSERG
jgi:hypothetical protein